jgi:hypothetical protein
VINNFPTGKLSPRFTKRKGPPSSDGLLNNTMIMIFIEGVEPNGEVRRFGFGGLSLTDSFEVINQLARLGTALTRIELIEGNTTPVLLPIEAFDGSPIAPRVKTLQAEWQALLS